MKVTDKTDRAQSGTVAFEVELDHAPAKVWRALTKPELLSQWLLPTVGFELEVGAEFMLKTQPYPGWDGTVSCKLLEIDEPRKISYTWTVPFLDTVVTFSLTPIEQGTRLSIVQEGFKTDQKREHGGARYGWKMMSEKLVEVLAKLD